jgi:hypothetical protein
MLLDGTSFNSNQYLDFIVFVKVKFGDKLGFAFDDQDEIVLGYRTTIKGVYTIDIDEVDGVLRIMECTLLIN